MKGQVDRDTIKLARFYRKDLRAWISDLVGVNKFTDDQEKHIQALQTQDTVAAMGAPGCGKSFIEGIAALWKMTLWFPVSCFFSAPTESSAFSQAWKNFMWAYNSVEQRAVRTTGRNFLGGELQRYSYSLGVEVEKEIPDATSHWAKIKACPKGEDGSSLRGQLHAKNSLVVLQEANGVDASAVDSLWFGTRAKGASFWYSFNPIPVHSGRDSAKELWAKTKPEGRVQYSLLRSLEWQDKNGELPGMTNREIFNRDLLILKDTSMWFPLVLGEYAPESDLWVVIPGNWFDICRDATYNATEMDNLCGIGVDTAGGRSENVIAVVNGRTLSIEFVSREQHQTPILITRVKEIAERHGGKHIPIAVDIVGQGGKGVADGLLSEGYNVIDFVGGGKEFAGQRDTVGLYADVATWAWFSLRDAARITVEGTTCIKFPNDPILREQLSRRYVIAQDRKYKLVTKDSNNSPDRADACAMAWFASRITAPTIDRTVIGLEDIMPGVINVESANYGGDRIESGNY